MGRMVIVVPLREGAGPEVRTLLREGPPLAVPRLERYLAFVSSEEAVLLIDGADLGPGDGLPWEDPAAWRDGPRWARCAAATPRAAEGVHGWERPPDLQGVFFGPEPGPGDSEGGNLPAAGGTPPSS